MVRSELRIASVPKTKSEPTIERVPTCASEPLYRERTEDEE